VASWLKVRSNHLILAGWRGWEAETSNNLQQLRYRLERSKFIELWDGCVFAYYYDFTLNREKWIVDL
jgi:hypothetical protein